MIKVIFWDFDGVILDSNKIRDYGFLKCLEEYPEEQVNQLMEYHRLNGGFSRYVKFRYFFEEIRKEQISVDEVDDWAQKFSKIVLKELVNPELLIQENLNYIMENHQSIKMHVVSGSDQNELRYVCSQLGIDHYFQSIHGSPNPKRQLVTELLTKYSYKYTECILIGDSINDYLAAKENNIHFMSYNNPDLEALTDIKLF
jgi:phosphoglycolate phosphatase-like HAD superfamily hydrolase